MPNLTPLSELKQIDLSSLKNLKSDNERDSQEAGLKLTKAAAEHGLTLRDYLTLALSEAAIKSGNDLNGYELALAELNLPVRNDLKNGVFLQAASDTFQTYSGTRALFPEVIDDVVRFAVRQDQFERVEPMLAGSRTISGTELLSTVIDDESAERDTFTIPELANIPVRTVKTSEQTVKFYKHGSAIRTSYEFNRRQNLDVLTPFLARVVRELELSKVKAATATLINGDGLNGAAPVVAQSSYNGVAGTATDGKINWKHFLYWLMQRAKAGTPIDTVVMNWDGYFQWMLMFSEQNTFGSNLNGGHTTAENLAKAGVSMDMMPRGMELLSQIRPVLSSQMPAGQLLGYSQADTIEELVEAGSRIQESENAIKNQSITMVRTENTGYKIVYGDTRSIFDFDES